MGLWKNLFGMHSTTHTPKIQNAAKGNCDIRLTIGNEVAYESNIDTISKNEDGSLSYKLSNGNTIKLPPVL